MNTTRALLSLSALLLPLTAGVAVAQDAALLDPIVCNSATCEGTERADPGNDSMNEMFDDDLLLGGTGDDLLRDGSPDDKDRLFGGSGKDDCTGDQSDRFVNCEKITRPDRRVAVVTDRVVLPGPPWPESGLLRSAVRGDQPADGKWGRVR